MPSHRLRRVVQGQGGFTLIELLIVMPLSILLLGLVIQMLGQAGHEQQDIESRTEALRNGELGLERMTREVRQATDLHFRSSSVVDLNVRVRTDGTSDGVFRLVRHDCSSEVCVRSEGPAVTWPPGASPSFDRSETLIGESSDSFQARYGQLIGTDVFRPLRIDPATGARTVDFNQPTFLEIRLRMATRDRERSFELYDGVTLRNLTTFAP